MKRLLTAIVAVCMILTLTVTPVIAFADGTNGEYSILTEDYVRVLGRGEITENGRSLNWSNSGIEFKFNGTKFEFCANKISNSKELSIARFNVSVDGGEPTRVIINEGWNTVLESLEPGEHTVHFVRSSEGIDCRVWASVIRVDGDAPVPTEARARKMEIIGDSYSAGYGNLPELYDANKTSVNTDCWYTYGMYAARHFDADANILAVSGKGICMNYATNVEKINDDCVMPVQFESSDLLVSRNDSHSQWDFTDYQPQVVTVFLGTNDYTGSVVDGVWGRGTAGEYFKEKYLEFYRRLRNVYPNAHLILCSKSFDCYHDVVDEMYAELAPNDERLHRLIFTQFDANGVHGHPTKAEHEALSKYLIEKIEEIPNVWEANNTTANLDELVSAASAMLGEIGDKSVTRLEFIEKIIDITGQTKFNEKAPFSDCNSEKLSSAYNSGLVFGTGDNKFSPDEYITREEMAVIAKRAIKWLMPGFIPDYSAVEKYADDESISSWAKESVYFVTAVAGKSIRLSDNCFNPQSIELTAK